MRRGVEGIMGLFVGDLRNIEENEPQINADKRGYYILEISRTLNLRLSAFICGW
jgi:hypothetical protein